MLTRYLETKAELIPFLSGIDEFCKKHLPAAAEQEEGVPKTFADPVERYATLAPWEVAIVDTPLFQRLRFIRQLGMAYLIYPTLGYSRFEHTIGVTARLKQVVVNLEENRKLGFFSSNLPDIPRVDQWNTSRLACLFHDVGHCIFSHVSESVIEQLRGDVDYPSSKVICEAFSSYAGKRLPMAEIFAASMLVSPSFIRFLQDLEIPEIKKRNARKFADAAANLVMGLPIPDDPHSLFLAQLMSSGLDVDKLDYMLRESHFTGITLGISLDWLLRKLCIRELLADQLPEGLKQRVKSFRADSQFAVLALQRGGQFAFEEFCIARLALHEKIYLHQKIRSAESSLKAALLELPRRTPQFQQAHRWLYLKEAFVDNPAMALPTLPDVPDLFEGPYDRNAEKLGFQAIAVRNLLHRAYGFGWQNAIAEPIVEERGVEKSKTDQLMEFIEKSPGDFLNAVNKNLENIRSLVGELELPKADGLTVLIDPPRLASIQQGHDTIYFEHPSRLPIRWTMPIDKIVDYYHRNRALGYIFSSKAYIPYVLLASERAAWDLFKVIYVQDVCVSGRVLEKVKELRSRLDQKGYYHDVAELQPVSDYLNSVAAQNVIARIAKKLALYDPRTKRHVSPASVTTFASQFPADLQDAALAWLQALRWIDPSENIKKAIEHLLDRKPFATSTRIGFCPLGASTDSASRIAYSLRDQQEQDFSEERLLILPLSEALGRQLDAYVLYDDNMNTGKQALNIMSAWMGISLPAELDLKEPHVFELSESDKKELQGKPLAFVFAVEIEGARDRLSQWLQAFLKFTKDNLHFECGEMIRARSKIFSGTDSPFQHQDKMRLKDYVRDVSESVMRAEGKAIEKAKEQSLGYGAAEAMVVFPYNCPTMTIPALWISGQYKEKLWTPLTERTRRNNAKTGKLFGEDA